jgi:hypothetical protein
MRSCIWARLHVRATRMRPVPFLLLVSHHTTKSYSLSVTELAATQRHRSEVSNTVTVGLYCSSSIVVQQSTKITPPSVWLVARFLQAMYW